MTTRREARAVMGGFCPKAAFQTQKGRGMTMKMLTTGLGMALTTACLLAQPAAADTLKTIRDRGKIICGTSTGVAGFSTQDASGRWQGFDIDICRALAVVIFNDTEKASFVPLTSKDRLIALQAGEVDVLPRTTTWTLARNSGQASPSPA
jgi:general L-amino acid transport system substrate-binding protein